MKENKTEKRAVFTKEMRATHTILIPMMLPVHFAIIRDLFSMQGYKMELLENSGPGIISTGLKYVHNDTCYPALIVIGQMIEALQSGKYDLDKVALMITQTGGGCRASNYIHLLRKAMDKAGLSHIPVISLNISGLESNPGFKLTLPLLRQLIVGVAYGDLMMQLENQIRPYECNPGETNRVTDKMREFVCTEIHNGRGCGKKDRGRIMAAIAKEYAKIKINKTDKIKVGIVGEIYVKYSPVANNYLQDFLESQGCEVMVPGLMGFLLYCTENKLINFGLYGDGFIIKKVSEIAKGYMNRMQDMISDVIKEYTPYLPPTPFDHLRSLGDKVIGCGCQMGEGWLLTAEMEELIETGYENIVCAQPFGCLPNHIVGKGMIRKLREAHPGSNIVAIDYDPGATRVNQENRIKLMLSMAEKGGSEIHKKSEKEKEKEKDTQSAAV